MSAFADWPLLLWAQSTCSQSRAADRQDAGVQRHAANVGCTTDTGRRAGEGAGSRVTAAGQKP